MNEVRTLLSLELCSLYGINQYLHTKDKRAKTRYLALGTAWLFLIGMVFFYVGGFVYALCSVGLSEIVPAYLVMLVSLMILAFGIFTAGSRIFGKKGYDLLVSMPVKESSIVASRFLAMYAEDLVLACVIMLPGAAIYGICQRPGVGFYLLALTGTLFIPAIPLVTSVLLGTLILAASSRMKSKSLVQTALMVLLVLGIMVGSFRLEESEFTPEAFASLAKTIQDIFGRLYPPALWLGDSLVKPGIMGFAWFILFSAAVVGLAFLVVSNCFRTVMLWMMSDRATHDYQVGAMETRSLLKALYIREARRYFASSIYVTNTIIGPIMGVVLTVGLCISGIGSIQNVLPSAIDLPGMLPFVFSAVFCLMTTTCTSISMEGRQFWVVKSLPVSTKALLDSKILLNLSLMLPFYIVSEAAMVIAVRPGMLQFLWIVLLPALLILFSVIFGITVNLKFHSFDWTKEEAVVKQSIPAALGGFSGPLLAALLAGVVFLVPEQFREIAKGLMCLSLICSIAWLYQRNNQACLDEL